MQPKATSYVWRLPEAFTTTLVATFVDAFGTEGLSWTPETIQLEIQDNFGVNISDATLSKLMAGITLLTTNNFYQSVPDFIMLSNILAGGHYDPNIFDPADVEEIAWAVTEALLLAPPDEDDEEPFAEEVLAYIAHMVEEAGFIDPPDVLRLGARGTLSLQNIQADYSDDPEAFSAIYKVQVEKRAEVDSMVRENLRQLIAQLSALPLANGNTRDIATKLARQLQK